MKIIDAMTPAAVLEQLAEECAELGQAALKYARILRRENPTPVTENEAMEHLREELADVRLVVSVIEREITGELCTSEIEVSKAQRWINRLSRAATLGQEKNVVSQTTRVIIRKVKRNEQNS